MNPVELQSDEKLTIKGKINIKHFSTPPNSTPSLKIHYNNANDRKLTNENSSIAKINTSFFVAVVVITNLAIETVFLKKIIMLFNK